MEVAAEKSMVMITRRPAGWWLLSRCVSPWRNWLPPVAFVSSQPVWLCVWQVLERQQELTAHEFKSQWGRCAAWFGLPWLARVLEREAAQEPARPGVPESTELLHFWALPLVLNSKPSLTLPPLPLLTPRLNEFVCPELARRAGLSESGYDRHAKAVSGSCCTLYTYWHVLAGAWVHIRPLVGAIGTASFRLLCTSCFTQAALHKGPTASLTCHFTLPFCPQVRLDLRVPSSSTSSPAPPAPPSAPPAPSHAAATPNPVARPAPAVVGTPSPSPGMAAGGRPPALAGPPPGLPMPIPLAGTAGGPGVVPFMAAPPAPCGYCQVSWGGAGMAWTFL